MIKMSKIYIRVINLIIAATGIVLCFIFKVPFFAYMFLAILLINSFTFVNYLRNRADNLATIRNLKYFRETLKTQKVLVHRDSDISELIMEVNHLLDAYETLKAEKQIQGERSKQLLSNLSHDIRTPLTSIIGYVDALNDGVITSEEEFKDFIEILSMKSKNLKHLTDQIFNVARIDADDVVMNFEYIELNDFMRNTVIDFIPQFEKYKLDFVNEIKEDRYVVYADRVALTRIFQNILKNAIQHGKDGKVIGVRTRIANNYYRVIIWDKGKGIPKAKQQFIFERLFKVDDARKFGASNSGLGMSIAKRLVDKHDGKIALTSQENNLTEFFIELPILKELKI